MRLNNINTDLNVLDKIYNELGLVQRKMNSQQIFIHVKQNDDAAVYLLIYYASSIPSVSF